MQVTLGGIQDRLPRADLEYVRLLVTTLIAVLVLPLVLAHLFLHPRSAAEKAIGAHVS